MDTRSAHELRTIESLYELHEIDPTEALNDPNCDMPQAVRRVRMILAVREAIPLQHVRKD